MTSERPNIQAIVTDVEGTAASISFVKEMLFPYAHAHLPAYVHAHASDPAVIALLDDTRTLEGRPELDTDQTIALLLDWITADRKATPLKALQGLIWDEGFAKGDLFGDVYADAAAALRRWHVSGIKLYVYSSGSVQAQRLVFGFTRFGDLNPVFSGYFDTRVGPKMEPGSYLAISAAIGVEAPAILFLSDSVAELDAAHIAGLQTICLDRGEAVIAPDQPHPSAQNFDEVDHLLRTGLP